MLGRISRIVGLTACVCGVWALTGAGCLTPTGGGVIGAGSLTNLPPVAIIAASQTTGIAPLTVVFSSASSTDDGVIVRREWDFGDGGSSLDLNPSYTFATLGTFTVTLTLTDDAGAVTSTTQEINVTQAPIATITVDRTTANEAPATFNFSAAASFDPDGELESIQWDFGDGTIESLTDLPHTFTQSGTFRVRLTVTDNVGVESVDEVLIAVGIINPQVSIQIPPDTIDNIVVPQDGTIWIKGIFDLEAGVPSTARAGVDEDEDAFNANDVQLDTDPPSGNDLQFDSVRGLQVGNVATLGGQDVPTGAYRLWAEVDTDRSDPSRTYANATINVVEAFSTALTTDTPVIPLVNDRATVIVNAEEDRQIFDLGAFSAGDRLFMKLVSPPEFSGFFDPRTDFSLMILDVNEEIIAWYQRDEDEDFVLYTAETRLIVPQDTNRLFVVMDGGFGVDVEVQRGTNLNQPNPQNVLLVFGGSDRNVAIAGEPSRNIVSLAGTLSGLTAGEIQQVKDAAVARAQALFAGFGVQIVTDDQIAADPDLALPQPFATVYVGTNSDSLRLDTFGIADYIDPTNDTVSGQGLVYADNVDDAAGGSPANVGLAIGNRIAHEIGHLLGLRHTDTVGDVMEDGGLNAIDDPALAFTVGLVAEDEQFGDLDPIGIQNAPSLLEAAVGTD